MPSQDLARTAFAAYTAAVGGTTHDNRPIPSWEHLGPTVQSGWVAAAAAVSAGVIPVAGQVAELVTAGSEILSAAEDPARHRSMPPDAVRRLQSALAAISAGGA